MLELRNLTWDNYQDVLNLKVAEDQKHFAYPTAHAIAEAYIWRNEIGDSVRTYAIYADEKVVGFIKYWYGKLINNSYKSEKFYGESTYEIWSFMIDEQHQGKGYGRLALTKVLEEIRTSPLGESKYISVSYWKNNVGAEKLYQSVGFVETGATLDYDDELGREVFCLMENS